MSEPSTSDPRTGMDKFFDALRGIGVRRRTQDTWFRGVCSGLADRLGVDPVIVRAALVLLVLVGGAGITIYLVAWALLPNDRDEIVAQKALRDGDGGSVVVIVFAALALFGGSLFGPWWGGHSGWGFPWGLAFIGLLIWWLVSRSDNHPDAGRSVGSPQAGTSVAPGQSPTAAGSWPAASGPQRTAAGPWPAPSGSQPASQATAGQAVPKTHVPKKLGRRSGGVLMAMVAIGVALATYGALIWAGTAFSWTGDHRAIALAGSLAAMGLLMVVLGLAGWRAGFVGFLAVLLAVTAWSSTVIPPGLRLGGQVGDATWAPTSVSTGPSSPHYQLGVGDAVLDLSRLPTEGLSEARIPAYVGLGELQVVVPEGLTVKVLGHVGLGEIRLPTDARGSGQGGSDVSRSIDIGDGPTEVVVDAGVGVGQLTVVKE